MADNLSVTPGSGATVAADDVGGVLYQRVKIGLGADGAATDWTGIVSGALQECEYYLKEIDLEEPSDELVDPIGFVPMEV